VIFVVIIIRQTVMRKRAIVRTEIDPRSSLIKWKYF